MEMRRETNLIKDGVAKRNKTTKDGAHIRSLSDGCSINEWSHIIIISLFRHNKISIVYSNGFYSVVNEPVKLMITHSSLIVGILTFGHKPRN